MLLTYLLVPHSYCPHQACAVVPELQRCHVLSVNCANHKVDHPFLRSHQHHHHHNPHTHIHRKESNPSCHNATLLHCYIVTLFHCYMHIHIHLMVSRSPAGAHYRHIAHCCIVTIHIATLLSRLSQCILLHCYTVKLLHCYIVTLPHCHIDSIKITLSQCTLHIANC